MDDARLAEIEERWVSDVFRHHLRDRLSAHSVIKELVAAVRDLTAKLSAANWHVGFLQTRVQKADLRAEAAEARVAVLEAQQAKALYMIELHIEMAVGNGWPANQYLYDLLAALSGGSEHPCGDYPAPCNCDDPETHNGRGVGGS